MKDFGANEAHFQFLLHFIIHFSCYEFANPITREDFLEFFDSIELEDFIYELRDLFDLPDFDL